MIVLCLCFPKQTRKKKIELISHLPGQFEQLSLTDTWKIQASLMEFEPMSSAFPNEPNKRTCSQMSAFIAQLIEHCTGITEVMGLIPVETA